MIAPTRAWKRSGALIAGAALGLVGVGVSATPASAHTPVWTVTCSEVTIDLKAYSARVTNTVTVTADGKDLLPTQEFGREFSKTLQLPEHKAEIEVRLVVKAGDGDRFSRDETKTAPVCESPEPSEPPQEPEPSEPPSKEPPNTEPPSTEPPNSEAPPAPAPSTPPLAETGGSSATPLIAGAAAAAVAAGAGILVVTRRRRAARG
ncbi:LPXTG cell wall anchor domain-containing protein [Streptomyces sp. PKU-MA01144]|uniref:LAETG motif-containing sortase-dependent surface protein n=1 Tax=Streptomyces sp. PKU-MA01144 TaxID=2729138 RepID=UPI00147FCE19|nr:LAETG motif-containing sortase-dependent surface protein [Streptomyces sp. PKU-MA01144]NNJ04430.1 LPXTG cell wall anchor domain-containing protein [Streptomyces sp. PKU-MA01144]